MRASVLKRLMEIEDEHLRNVLVDVVEEMERELATKEMLEAFVQRTDENFKRVWEAIHELVEAQKRTEQRVEELVEAQKRTEEELRSLAEGVHELHRAFWGEKGRLDGEQYERKIVQSARRLLGKGEGGSPSTGEVQRMLDEMLKDVDVVTLDVEEDPYLADLIWKKDGMVLVVEISLVVDRWDVVRAKKRAEVMRRGGIEAKPVVMGERWATEDTKALAEEKGVAWYVGGEFSPDLVEIRRKT